MRRVRPLPRTAALLAATIVSAIFIALPSPAQAAGERCEYDLQCFSGETCWDGVCTPEDALPDYVGADEACGSDRRCRLDRLARRGRATRRLKIIEEEKLVRQELERQRRAELDARPREKHPWTIDWRFTIQSPVGFAAGYTFAHPFRVELGYLNIDQSYFTFVESTGTDFDGDIDANFLDAGLVYNVLESTFSPYLKASAMYGFGTVRSFSRGFLSDGGGRDLSFHALNFEGGFDLMFDMFDRGGGFHMRFGAAFRPLIFHQARISEGVYDEDSRVGMGQWWDEEMFIDLNVQLGWGF